MRQPKDAVLVAKLRADLQNFDQNIIPLNGIQNPAAMDCLLLQLEDSVRRVKYVQAIAAKAHDPNSVNPNLNGFNPLNAAAYHLANGNVDEAAWLVFLATHFGKDKNGWGLMRAVYSGLGTQTWDWATVSAAPQQMGQWIAANQNLLKAHGIFGNHRKYTSLKYTESGRSINSYVDWIGPQHSHVLKFAQLQPANANSRTRFNAIYRSFFNSVFGFARMGAFDFVTMIGKIGVLDVEPDLIYIKGATGPIPGAKLLFADNVNANISNAKLEADLGQLEALIALPFGMQILEDALCNWQKSPQHYRNFKG